MKAAIRRTYVPFDQLEVGIIDKPTPKANEVLIRVYATTVNRTDCAIVTGKPYVMRLFLGLSKPKSPLVGTDFAGQVEAIGEQVTSFKVGDRVMGFNDEGLYSQAEYMTFGEDDAITTIPDNFTYEQAAASLEGVHYALNFINKIKLNKGDKVLVNGATGGIGSAAVQLLKHFGAYVTAVGNTKNMELLKSLGADKVYNYEVEDFTEVDEEKYHFIADAVGKSEFGKCKKLLLPKGIYISSELGPRAENLYLPLITKIKGGKRVIFPIPKNCKRTVLFIKDLIEKGAYNPVIEKTYPLEKIAEAYQYVSTGQKTGNVVININ